MGRGFRRYEPAAGQTPLPSAFARRGTVGEVASQAGLFQQVRGVRRWPWRRQRPLLLLLDDLHWADPASLDLLRSSRAGSPHCRCSRSSRIASDELTRRHALYRLLPVLVREASAARLDLGTLDDAAVRALVAARYHFPDADLDRLTDYLQARAEGNALFVGELLRSLEEARHAAGDRGGVAPR